MVKKTSPKSRHIPGFASIKEEAAFWDTHSTANYEAEFMPVRVRFAKRRVGSNKGTQSCIAFWKTLSYQEVTKFLGLQHLHKMGRK